MYTLAGKCLHFITGDDQNTKLSMAWKKNFEHLKIFSSHGKLFMASLLALSQANGVDLDQTVWSPELVWDFNCLLRYVVSGPHSTVGSVPDSRARGPKFSTFIFPSTDSRRVVISYWSKYMH